MELVDRLSWIRVLISAALGLVLGACEPLGAVPTTVDRATAVMTVATSIASRQRIAREITATGTVMAWQEVSVGAQLGGLAVVEVLVTENETVRVGDVLLKLDDRALRAQAAHQRAVIAEAEANLRSANSAAGRGEALVASRVISQESIETRRVAVLTSQAKLDQARASLDQLQVQLEQTLVRAPVNGVVLAEPLRIGSVPQAGAELARIARDGRLEVQARVPERDIREIARGQNGRVSGPDGSTITAQVRDVAARVDAASRLATVYLRLPDGAKLKPGMFATASLVAGSQDGVLIPEQALVWSSGKPAAFIVGSDGTVSLRLLSVADRWTGQVVVSDGLEADDRVVTAGAGFLRDGDAVRIEPALTADVRVSH